MARIRSGKKDRPRPRRRLLRLLLAAIAALAAATTAQVILLRFVPPPFTVPMAWAWLSRPFSAAPYRAPQYRWVSLGSISPQLRRAVIAAEDQRFLDHRGFDLTEMKNAVDDALHGDRLRGASTISMQVARSVFLPPSRTLIRKAIEAYYTVLIELLWNKPRILEMYLNTVDWGDGIVGAEAAARVYFKIPAARLTGAQAALLAAVLPNPHRLSVRRPGPFLRRRQQRILADMTRIPLLR